MLKFMLATIFLLLSASNAFPNGKVFPTRFPMSTPPGTARLIVKNVSEIKEFADLISDVDDTRRFLELREGIAMAKANQVPCFTFRRICGTKYADVFGTKKM
jgi:hypothetical protein